MDVSQIQRIGVIGAGTMGSGIAQVFLGAGCSVTLCEVSAEQRDKAPGRIEAGLQRWENRQIIPSTAEALERLRLTAALDDLAAAQWVVEAIIEELPAKAAVFTRLGEVCPPETVFASNTSSISITHLGASGGRPERTIGMHFFNPPPVMKLVEVIPGLQTDPEVLEATCALSRRLGKTAAIAKDRPGFIANRILAPLLNEAINALDQGIGTAHDIDTVFKLGMAHPMGPLELADLIGLDVCLAILEVLHRDLGDPKFTPSPLLRKHVEAGWLGRKTGRGFYEYPA